MKCQRVMLEESFVPALEDDAIEVQHLLAEPKTDNVSVDGVFCFGSLGSSIAQGQDELELGVLDGLLDGVDEVDDIHAANDISGACEEFLLDIELAQFQGSHLGNTSESQSPVFSGGSNGARVLSESSTVSIPPSEHNNGSEKTVVSELDDLSKNKFVCQEPAKETIMSTSHGMKNPGELNDAKPLVSGMSYDENGKKAVPATKGGTFLSQKRLRKPTKRYIEESSDQKLKHVKERKRTPPSAMKDQRTKIRSQENPHHVRALTHAFKEETISEMISQITSKDVGRLTDAKSKRVSGRHRISSAASLDKRLKVRSQNELHCVRALKSAPSEESFTGVSTLAVSESRPQWGRPKKHGPLKVLESSDEHTMSESEDDHVKRKRSKKWSDRRKHQRMWTLSEVMKLIDGIAQYGTGRWTDIKKLLFSSSAYRTPIDLRDKWRNLLRASCSQKQNQNDEEDEENLKTTMRILPKSLLRRVRELASIHPYPRFTPGGRYIRKKN